MSFKSYTILCIFLSLMNIKIFYKTLDSDRNEFLMSSISTISFIITLIFIVNYVCIFY